MRSFLIIVIIFLCACSSKQEEIPENILPPERMQEVLWDMIRADMYSRDNITDSNKTEKTITLYREILHVHKTTQDQFRESFNHYRAHPQQMKALLDSLEKRSKVQIPKAVQPADTAKKFPVFKKRDTLQAQ